MIKIGITGGIGSGKSLISTVFETLGYPVYNSDVEAKQCYVDDLELKRDVIKFFGAETYTDSGELNRAFLAQQVFNDDEKLKTLNKLVHPHVQKRYQNWLKEQSHQTPIIFKEAAILMETGQYKEMDYNVLVVADEELRIERVMARDNVSREEVLLRISKQWPEEKKKQLADYLILNDNTEAILSELINLPAQILKLTV